MTRSQALYLLIASQANRNFELAQSAKIFNTKFTNRLEKKLNAYYQRLPTLSFFHNKRVY